MSVEQRDALLLFCSLCKVCTLASYIQSSSELFVKLVCFNHAMCLQMGVKEGNDELTTKTRILSLELLQVSFGKISLYMKFLCELVVGGKDTPSST